MSEWATYTISEACKRFSSGKGIAASQIFEIGAYPVFGGNGIRGYTDTYNFEGECAIIGRQGAYCGNTKYFCGKAYMTEHAIVATANDEHNIGYIANLLSMMNLGQYQGQSAQPGLSVNTLSNIELKLPDKETQDSIFSLLSALDKKIALNKQINARLEEMAKTLYDYWFVQFDFPDANGKPYKSSGGEMVFDETLKREIPKGWEVKSLGEHITIKRGISYKSNEIKDTGVPFINLNSFYLDGKFKFEGTKFFTGKTKNDDFISSGDLLIAVTDVTRNADIIGKAFILPDLFNNSPVMSCDVAKISSSELNNFYLERLFNSSSYHEYIKYFASGTLVLHLDIKGISWFDTYIPPRMLLDKFEDFCRNIHLRMVETEKQNHRLTQLRDFLLPMLMNGQVSVAE